MKRAGIYIRVSTEAQADKVSPDVQEREGREYCETRGYQVVGVYRDVERYRASGRMVEPSGTRSDRPQFLRMLADIDAGLMDVVIAWREDRLYRNVNKAMLEISERVTKNAVMVELVKENYDPSTAVVKAWAAGIELQARRDRTNMGVKARLGRGENWMGNPPYGYIRTDDGEIIVNEVEAAFIRDIWHWYGQGVTIQEIRRRLINSGAEQQQRGGKFAWARQSIYNHLWYEPYYTGIAKVTWGGETYDCIIPVIVDPETARRVQERRARYKVHPAGNQKARALVSGLVYCKECGLKMSVIVKKYRDRPGKTYMYYACTARQAAGFIPDGCCGSVKMGTVDDEAWARVWGMIEDPERFNIALQERITFLQNQETDGAAEVEKLENQLNELTFERQKVITWARKKIITDEDLEIQLSVLDQQRAGITADLNQARLLTGGHAERLLELANLFTSQVRAGADEITCIPTTEAQAARQFEFRRRIINAIVSRVEIRPDKGIDVFTEWNFGELAVNLSINKLLSKLP